LNSLLQFHHLAEFVRLTGFSFADDFCRGLEQAENLAVGVRVAETDCIEFLRQVLAAGPKAYTDLEREACDAGLLEDGKLLSQSKPFRDARRTLGIKPSQPKGVKAGGWVWALPEHQMPSKASDALPGVRASDSERASDKVAVATGNIFQADQPLATTP